MNPVIFCKNSRGIFLWQHISTKCAPLSAVSLKRTPLLPMMPTGDPPIFAKPVTRVLP